MKEEDLKLGIFSWFGFVMPMPERLKLIKNAGFDSVAIWWEDEQGDKVIKKEDFHKIVNDSGLILENIHAPFGECNMFWNEDKLERNKIVKNHVNLIEECAKFNVPLIVMHVSEHFMLEEPNANGLKSFEYIIKAAEENNINIAIENTDNNYFIDYILSNMSSPNLGFCFDSSHNEICSRRDINLLKKHGSKLLATHISDNDGLADRHWIPYEGNIDWSNMKKFFPKNYGGHLSLEVFTRKEDVEKGPEVFVNKAYKNISKLRSYLLK